MSYYSVLICGEATPDELAWQCHRLHDVLSKLGRSYEVIHVTTADSASHLRYVTETPRLRVLAANREATIGGQLAMAIAAARGHVLIALEAGPHYRVEDISRLLARLNRADFVQGKRTRGSLVRLARRIARVPHWLLMERPVRDPGCLFWAARHEAVSHLPLSDGPHAFIASLVSASGYRVEDTPVDYARPAAPCDLRLSPAEFIVAWRLRRRVVLEAAEQVLMTQDSMTTGDVVFIPSASDAASERTPWREFRRSA